MANLVVDIGSTALKAAWTTGFKAVSGCAVNLGKTFRYQGEMMVDFILSLTAKERPDVLVISSLKDISSLDRERLGRESGRLVVIDRKNSWIYAEKEVPSYLSPDRLAAVVAARHLFGGKGCTIFDFGTTLTIDFLDENGRYSGGNISPGCRTRFKSLNRYSKNLPLLDTPDVADTLGDSLVSSVESGVITGIMFEIQGYFDIAPANIIIFTGGDAIYFAKRVKKTIFVICNLVLTGLAIVAAEYVD